MGAMKIVWNWIKKYWKWIVFPIGGVLALFGWYLWWRKKPEKDDVNSVTTDEAADKALKETVEAQANKERALKELEEEHLTKLSVMNDEQRKEFEEVRKKPIEEVAAWIDAL